MQAYLAVICGIHVKTSQPKQASFSQRVYFTVKTLSGFMNEICRLWTRPFWKAPRDVEGETKRIELLQEYIIRYADIVIVMEKR